MTNIVVRPVAGVGQCICTDNGNGTGEIVCKLDEVPKLVAERDKAFELLEMVRDWVASDENCGPQGVGLVCMIDDLLPEDDKQ